MRPVNLSHRLIEASVFALGEYTILAIGAGFAGRTGRGLRAMTMLAVIDGLMAGP